MLKFISAILFFSITGAIANIDFFCDNNVCDNIPLFQDLEGTIPNEEELKTICKPLLERLKCHRKAVKDCTGQDVQELTVSSNASIARHANMMLNVESVFIDLCDENSILRQGYLASEKCFNDMVKEPSGKCLREAVAVYDAYRESVKLLDVKMSDSETKDADCLITAYSTACYSLELKEKCGEIARATFIQVLKQVKFLSAAIGTCSPEKIAILKSEYLEFLELDQEKKSLFSEVFNTRK